MIELKISATETISVKAKDIDHAEYRTDWGHKEHPSIRVYMKDKKMYKVEYADEFKPLAQRLKRHNIKLIE